MPAILAAQTHSFRAFKSHRGSWIASPRRYGSMHWITYVDMAKNKKSESIFDAIEKCDVARIKAIVDADPEQVVREMTILEPDPEQEGGVNKGGRTPLACLLHCINQPGTEQESGHWRDTRSYREAVRYLLEINAPVKDEHGNTLAHLFGTHATVADFLAVQKEYRLDVNAPNSKGQTPLIVHFYSHHKDISTYLLECPEVDIAIKDNKGNSAIHHYVRSSVFRDDSFANIDTLLRRGADINDLNNDGQTPVGELVKRAYSPERHDAWKAALVFLVGHGALVDVHNPAANFPLIKNLSLGYAPNSPDGSQLFDRFVAELKDQLVVKHGNEIGAKITSAFPRSPILRIFWPLSRCWAKPMRLPARLIPIIRSKSPSSWST